MSSSEFIQDDDDAPHKRMGEFEDESFRDDTMKMQNSPDLGPIEAFREALRRFRRE